MIEVHEIGEVGTNDDCGTGLAPFRSIYRWSVYKETSYQTFYCLTFLSLLNQFNQSVYVTRI